MNKEKDITAIKIGCMFCGISLLSVFITFGAMDYVIQITKNYSDNLFELVLSYIMTTIGFYGIYLFISLLIYEIRNN